MMVFRIFVEKKPGFDNEAKALKFDINELLEIKGGGYGQGAV